jgi:hypothetical protein
VRGLGVDRRGRGGTRRRKGVMCCYQLMCHVTLAALYPSLEHAGRALAAWLSTRVRRSSALARASKSAKKFGYGPV